MTDIKEDQTSRSEVYFCCANGHSIFFLQLGKAGSLGGLSSICPEPEKTAVSSSYPYMEGTEKIWGFRNHILKVCKC